VGALKVRRVFILVISWAKRLLLRDIATAAIDTPGCQTEHMGWIRRSGRPKMSIGSWDISRVPNRVSLQTPAKKGR